MLAIYGGHDASVTFVDKDGRVRVIEVERKVKQRYASLSSKFDDRLFGIGQNKRIEFLDYLYDEVSDPDKIDTILFMNLSVDDIALINKFFPNAEFQEMNHHQSHAYCGHFQSGFSKTLIFSVDGGGLDYDNLVTTKAFLGDNDEV